jgi:alpha-L-fucosidase
MKKTRNKIVLSLGVLSLFCVHPRLTAAEILPESEAVFQQRMQWFTDAQFGLFIHYGVYSTLGGEWKGQPVPRYAEWIQRWGQISPEEYIPLAANFNPEKLDADLWVKTAKAAGMKYMVITTKHHEGFCLWDSALTEYDLGEATTFNRDILGELKAACDKYGIKFGTYYSIIDWHHPSQRAQKANAQTPMNDKAGYVAYMKGQLKELIERYHPAVMWFDGDWATWWTMEDGIDLYNYLRTLDPELVINNRVAKRKEFTKDYGTPENQTPGAALDHIWEACWTVNHSWGFKKSDTNWKSTTELIQKQIEINTKGGNLLLNVGPHADGSWPDESILQLNEMGAWNHAYSEAVYGTEYVELPAQTWGRLAQSKASTPEAGELFAYVFNWPANGKLLIQGLAVDQAGAFTYDGALLPATLTRTGLEIDLSSAKADPLATVLRITYSGMQVAEAAPSLDLGLTGNELILSAAEARLSGKVNKLEDGDHIGFWTDPADTASWTLNVPAPGTFAVKALYACDKKYSDSEVQLTVSGKTLTARVAPSKNWGTYTMMDLGVVELDQVGETTCTVGFGEHHGNALFNLKNIIFVPVAD